jgi:magnesium transporter
MFRKPAAQSKRSEMATPDFTARTLRRLLSSGVLTRAERLLGKVPPADLAPLLADLTHEEVRVVMELLFRQRRAALVLRELPPELLPQVFDALADQRLADVLARLEIDDLIELEACLPADRREEVRARLPASRREDLEKAELYPESSAGRAMTTNYVALDEKMTAQEAIDALRAAGDSAPSILYLYVVDELRALRGVVPIRRLVAAPPDRPVSQLMIRDPVHVRAEADQEEVAALVRRYDLLAIPVVDVDGRMLGVITVDDVIDVITEEATQDMYHLAGLSDDDRVFSPASTAIKKRLPWMLVNLITCFLAAGVVAIFEHTIEQMVALAVFMPVVAGMAGNGGIQALTVITRAIALGEIEFSTGARAAGKELGVGLALGAATGAASAGLAYLWHGSPLVGVALFLAMAIAMAVAGLVGAAVPLGLKALRQDPALGSGVIVTTFTDVFAFMSFLGIATLLMNHVR